MAGGRRLQCKAENPECALSNGSSVLLLGAMPLLRCDVCCAEPGFCPQCKCILCSRAIAEGQDEWIQCLQRVSASGGYCGHSVHLECAIQCRLAGVVVESGLDVEYLCRRCDRTTDLLSRVSLLVQAVAAAPSKQLAEGNAKLASRLVTNTRRAGLKRLETLVSTILVKAENGDDIQAVLTRMCNDPCNGNSNHVDSGAPGEASNSERDPEPERGDKMDLAVPAEEAMAVDTSSAPPAPSPLDEDGAVCALSKALVLTPQPGEVVPPANSLIPQYQLEIDRALEGLKRAQEQEYATAREKLTKQMDRILKQYQQLESDKSLLPPPSNSSKQSLESYDAFMERALQQLSGLKKDRDEFEAMLRISQGFGRVPKELLRSSFNWPD
ncbi:uncharacterized protein LOC112341453 [Selaginella moellendorffii]|uniref:uncharacterized protein LOC112341453 n=1 Tax=Selaginella moellendorffii TaxID=88036 RepID=UPI000D1C3637|nr:uncharacterized protein LOC112341453 [Selaginella moellendorffii]|eukprot:XP_024517319.1 uncharacterized protein LOC112341453 [Selaginella moellendorffii]